MDTVVAGLAALTCAWLLAGGEDQGGVLRRRLEPPRGGRAPRPRPRLWAVPIVAGVLALAGLLGGGRGLALALVATIATGTALDLGARARRRRRTVAAAGEVVRAGEALAGTLRTGAIPASALSQLAGDHLVLGEAAAAQAVGGDVGDALRRSAGAPGRAGLAELAGAWEVSVRTGASLGAAVEAIAGELAHRREVAATVTVELAASRAASRVMAVLPAVGVLLGYALGGDPVGFLLDNPGGWVCLVGAAGLAAAGLEWTDRIAERARR